GTDRLPRRQDRGRAPAGPGHGRPRGHDPELGNGGAGGLARSLGDEPDADQINVSTRRFGRAVRLPEGDVPAPPGSGVSKSAASRRFVALSAARLADFMAADLSALDLLVVQIDGLHLGDDLVLLAAIGIDGDGT